MKDKNLAKGLIDALSWGGVRELPPLEDKENIWIYAIAKVSKRDGSMAYVGLTKDDKGENKIVKDFGSVAHIRSIDEIYPTLYLDASYVPKFGNKKKEDRIKWLEMSNPEKGGFEEMSMKELNKEIIKTAIRNQKRETPKVN